MKDIQPESIEAYENSLDRTAEIIAAYRKLGTATADEIAVALGVHVLCVAPQVTHLKQRGILVPTDERRRTSRGAWARVMTLKETT